MAINKELGNTNPNKRFRDPVEVDDYYIGDYEDVSDETLNDLMVNPNNGVSSIAGGFGLNQTGIVFQE